MLFPNIANSNLSPSPMLNGENIVLLSFSNDTTPADTPVLTPVGGLGGSMHDVVTEEELAMDIADHNVVTTNETFGIARSHDVNNNNHIDEEEANDMTLSPSSIANNVPIDNRYHSSPPPESIHSGQITTLSPPPLSMKSSDSYADGAGAPTITSGSQSLFSRGDAANNRAAVPPPTSHTNTMPNASQQPHPPTVTSAGGNTAPSKKRRPPLPPRWALPPQVTTTGAGGGDMVDVVPSHLPPPKQIGLPLSHRRVLSTGDASFLSNLTDPENGYMGEDNSPPLTVLAAGAGAAVSGGGVVGGIMVGAPSNTTSSGVPNTANNIMSKPLPMNKARRRGVSWDFGAQVMAASHSESDGSVNRYKNEEEATFDTLGILQPILDGLDLDDGTDDDDDNDDNFPDGGGVGDSGGGDDIFGDLMQPKLMDDNDDGGNINIGGTSSSAFATPAVDANNPTTEFPPPLPPPPPPPPPLPKKVIQKQTSEKALGKQKAIPSSGNVTHVAPMVNEKDHTQFEDEADTILQAALNSYNLQSSIKVAAISGERSHVDDDDENTEGGHDEDPMPVKYLSPNENASSDHEEKGYTVPSQVVPLPGSSHRKDVSALTTLEYNDHSPHSSNGRKRGEVSLFEDSAWTEGYDAAGRIDGTLPEERDSMLVNEDGQRVGGGVGLDPRVSAGSVASAGTGPAPARPPLHPLQSGEKASSKRSIFSKRVVKDDDSTSRASNNDNSKGPSKHNFMGKRNFNIPAVVEDPTKTTGLRHRRVSTIAAKNMADELAQLGALHGGCDINNNDPHHQRTKTAFTLQSKDGGIDNLLAGADILARQEDKDRNDVVSGGKHHDQDAGANNGEEPFGNDGGPVDEEMGNNANDSNNRYQRVALGRRSEMLYHLRIWYHDLIQPKLPSFVRGATHSICFIIVPLLAVAFILYYGMDNPMSSGNGAKAEVGNWDVGDESWSWWVLLIVRQVFVLSCVKTGEVITIDILALRTPLFLKTVGSLATLVIVQARGWPYVLTFWSLFDFILLYGNRKFARHWLYWQDWVELFTASNPAGNFLHSDFYMKLLLAMMFVGVVTSLKRFWLATFLGRRSYAHYGPELEIILAKMLLVSQIARLGRHIDSNINVSIISDGYAYPMQQNKSIALPGLTTDSEDDIDDVSRSASKTPSESQTNGFGQSLLDAGIGSKLVSKLSKPRPDNARASLNKSTTMSSSKQLEIMQLLNEWEEPDIKTNSASKASIKDILQFRQAVSMMDDMFPFTPAFGPANTRMACVQSSENLFHVLQRKTPTLPLLPFETLSELAYDGNGTLMRVKVKALIKLFRPDRKGFLTKLDFVSSVDNVYKDLRLFRASLANSSSIDDSFEMMINLAHFLLVIVVVLFILGFKRWKPILSVSAFFFSFSFMFGPASSKIFEGILLIFVRRPYDIGDKIALSDPETDTSSSGSSTWFVEKVSLFTTTVRFATTNEVATYSNGSIARLRIINAKRSPKAIVYVYMKFGSDVPYHMIKVYQTAIEAFVKSRPRDVGLVVDLFFSLPLYF